MDLFNFCDKYGGVKPSRRTTLKKRRFNVVSTFRGHRINFEWTLFQHVCLLGRCPNIKDRLVFKILVCRPNHQNKQKHTL